jgi:hypothetical protein
MGFGKKLSGLGWRIAISPCVGVKSLADDLVVYDGRVNSRVVLLLRAIERNPSVPRFLRECLTAPSPHLSIALGG